MTWSGKPNLTVHFLPAVLLLQIAACMSLPTPEQLNRAEYQQNLSMIERASDRVLRNPKDPEGYADRATGRLNIGDFRGAVDDATQAIKIDPKLERAYRIRSTAKNNLGDHAGARADEDMANENVKARWSTQFPAMTTPSRPESILVTLDPIHGPSGEVVEISVCGLPMGAINGTAVISVENTKMVEVVAVRCNLGTAGFGRWTEMPPARIKVEGRAGPIVVKIEMFGRTPDPIVATSVYTIDPETGIDPTGISK